MTKHYDSIEATGGGEEWPRPEEPTGFDWSLSMREIEKKYAPLRPIVVKIVEQPPAAPKAKPIPGTILAKFRRKYPYVYGLMEEANADLPRWVIDNMLKISL
jgi:hypothetical protein